MPSAPTALFMHVASRIPCLLLLLTFCLLLLTGCDEPPTRPPAKISQNPRIGLLLYKSNDTYIAMVASSLQKRLVGHANILLQNAQGDPLLQSDQLNTLMNQQPDILIVNVVDPKFAAEFVSKAKNAGIPIIFFNREPDLDVLRSYHKARFVGTKTLDAGIMQGDLIKRLWDEHPEYDRNRDGKLQYILFQGNTDNPEALARSEYSVKQARIQGVAMEQLDATYVCNWDQDLAVSAMETALAAHPDTIELIIANNDAMALGALTTLNKHGYNLEKGNPAKFIPLVGIDATDQAIEAIRKGMMSATVKQDSESMAEAIVALSLNALAGRDFLENTNFTWDDTGLSIRIPYSPYMEPPPTQ